MRGHQAPGRPGPRRRLAKTADVVIENFRPGAMDKLGLGYAALSEINPRLIYCSLKGFLPGPYEHRTALDEVVQMMTGLAYMTGPPGQPLRAGTSVNDIMGGLFAVIAIQAALRERDLTGRGSLVQSGLFETNMVLVAQHMAQAAIEGRDPPSYADPNKVRPWPMYDVFDTADERSAGLRGRGHRHAVAQLLRVVRLAGYADDPELQTCRSSRRPGPAFCRDSGGIRQVSESRADGQVEALGLPFAPIARPSDLFEDPHLLASGGMLTTGLAADSAPAANPLKAPPTCPPADLIRKAARRCAGSRRRSASMAWKSCARPGWTKRNWMPS